MKQIFWAVLLERAINNECVSSLIDLSVRAGALGYKRMNVPYGRTDFVRNAICDEFMRVSTDPHDTLIMLDNDHLHNIDTLERLVTHDLPIVGVLAFRRGKPYDPIAFVRDEKGFHAMAKWEPGQLYKIDFVSPAAIAIQRRAFLHLEAEGFVRPWFRYTYEDNNAAMPSEDMYFADSCHRAGVSHYVDTGIVAPHLVNGWIDEHSWFAFSADHPDIIAPPKVSVIIPSRNRPERLQKSIASLLETTRDHNIEIICVLDSDDTASHELVKGLPVRIVENADPSLMGIPKWNMGAAVARGEWLVTGADDVVWLPGWLDDGHSDGRFATHYMVTRQFAIDHLGGVLQIPAYKSWYSDIEVYERAVRAQLYVFATDAHIEHKHAAFKEVPEDEIYQRGEPHHTDDMRIYKQRREDGFPNDFEAVIKEAVTA